MQLSVLTCFVLHCFVSFYPVHLMHGFALVYIYIYIEDAHGASTAAPKIVERMPPGGLLAGSWGVLGGAWRLPRSIMDQRPEEFNFLADLFRK